MKLFLPMFILGALTMPLMAAAQDSESTEGTENTEKNELIVFDGAVFYDGYRMENNPDKELEDGILRHSCSLYAKPLTEEQLNSIGEDLNLKVYVEALCDNYDRIGNVNIAFVPKGETTYDPWQVERIEIGRFITPFMDKNKEPNVVPYYYDIAYLSQLLRDTRIRNRYDLWLELEIFGVPYAANQQIKGCKDRNDVFKGTAVFETSEPATEVGNTILIPIVIKKPEYIGSNLNNYKEEATDTLGKTTKTYKIDLPCDVNDARIVLITSNHGANAGGEEYNRRTHRVYVDDALSLTYKPGRESCEPFRKYNTQANGIYGYTPMSDSQWQSFSNWCPGDVIDNRQIMLGDFSKGEHKIRIEVPRAKFLDQQGDIPVSMYLIATDPDPAKVARVHDNADFKVVSGNGTLKVISSKEILFIDIYNIAGNCVYESASDKEINVSSFDKGIYLVNVLLSDGIAYTRKVIL